MGTRRENKKISEKVFRPKKDDVPLKICKKSRSLYRYPIIRLKVSVKMERNEMNFWKKPANY